MMKKNLPILLFGLLFVVASCKKETTPQINNTEEIKEISALQFKKNLYQNSIDSIISSYQFNGNVAIFQDSIKLYQKSNGYSDFKNNIAINDSTAFAIASISKQFTTVMMMKLAEKNQLKITDSVFRYIPEFNSKDLKNVQIFQLMNHTSGIIDEGNNLNSKPGEKFYYSNKGYYYLGKIIEKASGKSFDEYAGSFFSELGLKNTFTSTNFKGNNFARAYVGTLKNYEEIPDMPNRLSNKNISNPAGGILTTINDLHLWNQKLYSGKIISKASLNQLLEASSNRKHPIFGDMGYGYGMMVGKEKTPYYFHSGYVKGGPSLMIYYPKTRTSIIILSNIANESLGKNAIFNPHKEIKKISYWIETSSQ